eukprot:6677418-Ditylum_brightwellii.AAC.1
MKYHMVTSHGTDHKPVANTTQTPICSIDQGATNAPPNWTLVPNIYQKAYTKHTKGALNANGKMFVDDKTLLHNGGQLDLHAITLMNIVTHDLSLWNWYTWTTGGLIDKTSYSLLVEKFTPAGNIH